MGYVSGNHFYISVALAYSKRIEEERRARGVTQDQLHREYKRIGGKLESAQFKLGLRGRAMPDFADVVLTAKALHNLTTTDGSNVVWLSDFVGEIASKDIDSTDTDSHNPGYPIAA